MTPEWINENWTEELLQVMFESRKKRIMRQYPKAAEQIAPNGKMDFKDFIAKHGRRHGIGYKEF